MRIICLSALLLLSSLAANAAESTIDSIRHALETNTNAVVQEKVFLHMDNTCYFVGDTLWYKAYVVRADNLQQTDMSRILYVELLNPDGLVVERQNIIISNKGFGNGCFALEDSCTPATTNCVPTPVGCSISTWRSTVTDAKTVSLSTTTLWPRTSFASGKDSIQGCSRCMENPKPLAISPTNGWCNARNRTLSRPLQTN